MRADRVFKTLLYFNPRSHERSDCIKRVTLIVIILFQSTLPREERPQETRMSDIHSNFNPRSHERSDDENIERACCHCDFNPRSHERSDSDGLVNMMVTSISIHAPTRGATCQVCIFRMSDTISIHAPTRGATSEHELRSVDETISIHAPTRGATLLE